MPRVRDFTATPSQLPVLVDVSPAYELALSLFAYGCDDRQEYEVGPTWFETRRHDADPALQELLDIIEKQVGELMVGLLGVIYDLPQPKTIEAFLDRLAEYDPVDLMVTLATCCLDSGTIDDFRRAVDGDADVAASVLEGLAHDKRDRIAFILELGPKGLQRLIIDALTGFAEQLLPDLVDFLPVLERDAGEKRALAVTQSPEKLVEVATNGVTFRPQPDVSAVVLIPAIVTRPWVVIAEHGTLRLFAYPVTDASMEAEPGTPPPSLVKFYKALGDEKRLHLLRALSEGPSSLAELTERLGLAKSTVHHHLSLLRQAGLIRVTVGDEREFSVRSEAASHAGALLQTFLSTEGASS